MTASFRVPLMLLVLILPFSGCAGSREPGSLELENVLQLKAEREARIRARDETRSREEAEEKAADLKRLREFESVQNSPGVLKDAMAKAELDPAELGLLDLTDRFSRVEDSARKKYLRDESELFSGLSVLWKHAYHDVIMMAGKTPTDPARIGSYTRASFLAELARVAQHYDVFYFKEYQTHATHEIRELKSLVVLEVTAKYLEDGRWHADHRYFYFFRPDYRLNLVISGSDQGLIDSTAILGETVKRFEERLVILYPEGILFEDDASE